MTTMDGRHTRQGEALYSLWWGWWVGYFAAHLQNPYEPISRRRQQYRA